MWEDVVMLMFCIVMFNHMGLCEAIEEKIRYKFKIISCVKCGTFWCCLLYLLIFHFCYSNLILYITTSFLLSYFAYWFELFLGYLTIFYRRFCDEIYSTEEKDTNANDNNS